MGPHGEKDHEKDEKHRDHGHGQGGSSHHHPDPSAISEKRLAFALILNLLITAAEVAGGILGNSLALLSDAVHNLSDAMSLGISWIAVRISRLGRSDRHTYGFKRAEVLAAVVNTAALLAIGVFLVFEAVRKFLHPEPISGGVVMVVAVIGLLGNLLTAWLLHSGSKSSMNIKSAYLHIVMDALSSVGVILAGVLIYYLDWIWTDPLITAFIALYVIKESLPILKSSVHIIMQGAPEWVTPRDVIAVAESFPQVLDFHHIHLWTADGSDAYLEAHVRLCEEARPQTDKLLRELKEAIGDRCSIEHVTLQFEFDDCCFPGGCPV